MSLRLLVNSSEFWPTYLDDLSRAKERAYVQTLSFEGDGVGRDFTTHFLNSTAKDKRLIVDDYSNYIINDQFLYSFAARKNRELQEEKIQTKKLFQTLSHSPGVSLKFSNPIRWLLFRLSARNHKKIFSIDSRVAYIGGINLSQHNFDWHDIMVRVVDPQLAAFLESDFLKSWKDENQGGVFHFDQSELLLFGGKARSREALLRVSELIASAKKSIHIISPYVSFPFFSLFAKAVSRGVDVRLLAPKANNWPLYDAYTLFEAQRAGIRLYFYPKMNHTKAILIDDKIVLVGSSNFDFFGTRLHQELLLAASDPSFVRDFRERVIEQDFIADHEEVLTTPIPKLKGRFIEARLKSLFWTLYCLNRFA